MPGRDKKVLHAVMIIIIRTLPVELLNVDYAMLVGTNFVSVYYFSTAFENDL